MGFESRLFRKMMEHTPTEERRKSVGLVASRLREKYKYDELDNFVTYLESMEKFFLDAEKKHENGRELKEDMIQTEMYLMSNSLGIDQRVLQDIYAQFQFLATTMSDVHRIIEKLLTEYPEKEYWMFIQYLRDITVIFLGYQEERVFTSEEIRSITRQATEAKMKILSVNGKPDPLILARIHAEFFSELEQR